MIILGQFATSTLVLALTMFQLTLVDPISEAAVTHVCYLLGISMEILLYCWFGNEVEIKVLPTTSMPPTFQFYFSEQSNSLRHLQI
jgi:hypothetical protein